VRTFWLLLLALLPISGNAAKPLFSSDEPIEAVLSAPLTQAYGERKKDVRLYKLGTFSFKYATDKTHRLDVKIRTRGNYRRLNCTHPPLHLNFVKKGNDSTLFEKQDKLKLVGPCKSGSAYQEYIGLEYLVYKLWEEMSPYHFKTRLVNLSYVDTDNKRKPWQATTFLIEDVDDVAKRSKRERLAQPKGIRRQMNLEQTALLEVFQLLIGNTDYSTLAAPEDDNCCHNARLLVEKDKTTDVIPVPYDFDVSGFVDAPYAEPPAQYRIKRVRQRYFTGWCKEDAQFLAAIELFKQRQASLYDIVQQASVISEKSRKKALEYLDSFSDLIDDPKRVQKEIIGRCRGEVIRG
jgi:hypothetical protein